MAHPLVHAQSSAKRFGGDPQDYFQIHDWFDESKAHFADPRHRALRHHSEGIYWAEQVFGPYIVRESDGVKVPTRYIGEQHVKEDLGYIPTLADWFRLMKREPWMNPHIQMVEETA